MAENGAGGSDSKGYKKPLVYIGGLVGLILTGIFTGVGEDVYDEIRKRLPGFETSVDGYVKRSEVAVPGVTVVLDNNVQEVTSSSGHFLFDDVPRGRHVISVEEAGNLLYEDSFTRTLSLSLAMKRARK